MVRRDARDFLIDGISRLLKAFFKPSDARVFPHWKAILVLLPCCAGDVLMATPTVKALRSRYPRAKIDFAVGAWSKPLLEGNPHLDELVDCGRVGEGRGFPVGAYLDLILRLRHLRYDACFVLARSPLLTIIPFLAGIPHRVGLDSEGRGFSLTVRVPVEGVRHELDRYLDTVRALGIQTEDRSMVFYPSTRDRNRADALLSQVRGERRTIAIHPGGGKNPGMTLPAKRWPSERFAALADALMDHKGWQVILVGGPSDRPFSDAVTSAMKHRPKDLVGRLSWGELGAFLQGCDLWIGNDTGAMHLAVAVGTPVIALFGPSDPRCYGPSNGRGIALWHDVGCNPCFARGRFNRHCQEPRCILAIRVEEVVETALACLKGESRGRTSG